MHKPKKRIDVITIIRILLLIVIIVSLTALVMQLWEYKKGTDSYNNLRTQVVQTQPQQEDSQQPEEFHVDFADLQSKNPDIIGWLAFDSVDISYPVLYSGDNSYYLRRLWDKSYNQAGSLFLEGNNKGLDDLHAIVYGHNMKNGSMFAPLKQYLKQEFYQQNGGWFTLYTPEATWRYQIFSVHQADPQDQLYTVGFSEGEQYTEFVKMLKDSSIYDTGIEVSPDDHVLTLSTCTDDGQQRIVVHARRAEQVE